MKRVLGHILTVLTLLLAIEVYAQSQTVTFNVAWTLGTVAGHTEWQIESCVGVSCTAFASVGKVAANVLAFSQTITNDPGGVTRCYRVKGANVDGATAPSAPGCGISPAILKPPSGLPGVVAVTTTVIATP